MNLTVDGSLDTTYDFVNDQILDGSSAGIRLTAQGSLGDRVTLSATGAAVARNGANGVDVVGTGSGDLRVNLTNIQLVSNESNNVLLDSTHRPAERSLQMAVTTLLLVWPVFSSICEACWANVCHLALVWERRILLTGTGMASEPCARMRGQPPSH